MFGKNPDNKQSVTPFGGNASLAQRRAFLASQNERKGGGGGGKYMKELRLSEQAERVRLIAGNYPVQYRGEFGTASEPAEILETTLEWYPFVQHERGVRNGDNYSFEWKFTCSGGPFADTRKRQECHGCVAWYECTKEERKKYYSKRNFNAITALHYRAYHEIEQESASGARFKDWEPCVGRGCPRCAEKVPSVPYRILPLVLGSAHFETLMAYNKSVGEMCSACSNGEIRSLAWLCGNEACGTDIIDMSSTTLQDSEILEKSNKPIRCPACGETSYMREFVECTGCSEPVRATLFDVDLDLQKVRLPNAESTVLQVPRTGRPGRLPDTLAAAATPLDLVKLYGPADLKTQLDKINKTNSSSAPAPGGRGYQPRSPVTSR